MVNYRRSFVPGGTFFFTVTLKNRRSNLLIERIGLLKDAFNKVKEMHPFIMKAYVIMPEHLHMIWELPIGDANYSLRWKKIKALFTKSIIKAGLELSRTKHNECRLWQRRFWEHMIKDESDLENHVNYIHYNPIKHGLVEELRDWPHSLFHYYVQSGRICEGWGSSRPSIVDGVCFGE